MKIKAILFSIVVAFLPAVFVYAQEQLPEPSGYVNDFAHVLSGDDKTELESLFSELEAKTSAETAVVTVESTRPLDIEGYAVKLFEKWGIGKKGKDNGILLLVALKDRKVRIEVGYGLEGVVPDALAKQIIAQVIIPAFKKGDYSRGIVAGSLSLVNLVAKEYQVSLAGAKDLAPISAQKTVPSSARLISLLFFIIIFGLGRGLLWWMILTPGNRRRGGFWYGGGMGGSSGGFSGGFGGFGGGFSGGGGASGGW